MKISPHIYSILTQDKTIMIGADSNYLKLNFVISDGIPVTVYKPKKCDKLEAPPILVYIHGGGNVVGSRKTHETVCKILARYLNV